jgi:hypothetical protein
MLTENNPPIPLRSTQLRLYPSLRCARKHFGLAFALGAKPVRNVPGTVQENSITMSFRKVEKPKTQLPQKEREAIVDLLHFCLYADSHIALKEGEFMADVVDIIGWETQISFGSYEAKSIAAARAAKDSPAAKQEFLSFAAERLVSQESQALALNLCKQLFYSDGATADNESALLAEIRAALKK